MPLTNPASVIVYPKVGARRTSNQSLTLNGVTQLVYNSEDYDDYNIYNASNGNIILTSSTEGHYNLEASVTANYSHSTNNGLAVLALVAFKNGSNYSEIGRATETGVGNLDIGASGSLLFPNLVAGDIITVRVSTTYISGGSINMIASAKNHLSFFKLP